MITKLLGVATLFAAGTIAMGAAPTLGVTDLSGDKAQAGAVTDFGRCGRRCGAGGGRCGRRFSTGGGRCSSGGGRCASGGGRCASGGGRCASGGGRCGHHGGGRCGHVAADLANLTLSRLS